MPISSSINGHHNGGDNDVINAAYEDDDAQLDGEEDNNDTAINAATPAVPEFDLSFENHSTTPEVLLANEGLELCSRDYFTLLKDNMTQLILIGVCATVYALLLACLYKQRINEIYLFQVSYVVMVTLLALDVCFSFTTSAK